MDIKPKPIRSGVVFLLAAMLAACGGSDGDSIDIACPNTEPYGCSTGETEPLYTFQWALNHADSWFKDYPEVFAGNLDLNVEPVHRQGIKGQGVKVLVVDSGVDLQHEDLLPNADYSRSWNLLSNTNDPHPFEDMEAHGTGVAGIIGAAQNGKGVMGIAPMASIAGVNYIEAQYVPNAPYLVHGGSEWSSQTDVFNASYGLDTVAMPYESPVTDPQLPRGLKNLRGGKGAIFIKAAGNSFSEPLCGIGLPAYFDCSNPANDNFTLEPNILAVAALNAKGVASSYSSAGSVVWVSGFGGEMGRNGLYGEGAGESGQDGPTVYTTDLRGCIEGYSNTNAPTPFLRGQSERNGVPDNPNCDYMSMNGTSSAAPTISGVASLVLSANPELTWRDVREILRLSARKVDPDYLDRIPYRGDKPYGSMMDLTTNEVVEVRGGAKDIVDGATLTPLNLGWQVNGAGLEYSNWYGFGLPDAERAVALAKEYAANPSMSRGGDVTIPEFRYLSYWYDGAGADSAFPVPADVPRIQREFPYKRITSLGKFTGGEQTVDQFQVRLTGGNVCLGAVGVAVRSPSGTTSILKMPDDHFRAEGIGYFVDYALGSYAFYGEQAAGDWELFLIASNPEPSKLVGKRNGDGTVTEFMSLPCPNPGSDDDDDDDDDDDGIELGDDAYAFVVSARIIAQ